MHYSARLTGLVAAVLAAACSAAPAAAAPVRTGSLQVADLSSRTVEVSMSRNGEHAPREGTVGLLVRNRAHGPRRLRVRYTAAESGDSFTVWGVARSPRHRARPEQPLDTPGGMVVPVSARDVVDLHVTFTALADATPDELVGRLVIVPERRKGRRVRGAPLILRIRGARAEERHVVVSPSK